MDLLCTETVAEISANICDQNSSVHHKSNNINTSNTLIERKINTALEDRVILEDRCLQNLLASEERNCTNICSYLNDFRNDITAQMRYIVADWMLQVCEEQSCQEEVYTLAVNYLDRFLGCCRIQRTQLQLLASACLLLASKLREPSNRALPPDVLVFYTENSITLRDLIQWELLVLAKLKWDVSVVTPQDFLGQLLSRLALRGADYSMVLRHAQAFIAVSARDHGFSQYTPSTICAASIVEALSGMGWFTSQSLNQSESLNQSKSQSQSQKNSREQKRNELTITDFIDTLHRIIGVEQDFIHSCWQRINRLVIEWTANQAQNSTQNQQQISTNTTTNTSTSTLATKVTTNDDVINNTNQTVYTSQQYMKHYVTSDVDRDTSSYVDLNDDMNNRNVNNNSNGDRNNKARKQTTSVTPTDVRDVHF